MKKIIKYNISIFFTWLTYIAFRKNLSQGTYDLVKDNYKSTIREKRMMDRIAKINGLSSTNKKENIFDGELTADNIYKYYLEQTRDEKEAQKLLDKLIKKIDTISNGTITHKGNNNLYLSKEVRNEQTKTRQNIPDSR